MLASNSVSTIFRCMSCSFGTHDQSTYAEHIKNCSNESASETLPVASDGEEVRNNSSETVKNSRTSYICTECHLPTGSSRALLLHQRDVHGKDAKIFVCKFCSSYASQHPSTIYKHAKSKHAERALKGTRVYTELRKESVIEEPCANNEANTDVHCISALQATPCEQDERSISDTVISSRSLGLHFLGRQLLDNGRDEFICLLCTFSHIVSHIIVKHIWKDHTDKLSEVMAEAATGTTETTENVGTTLLYKCDHCSYSTREKFSFYNHCSHHQFKGPSKCPHCSFCAVTDGAISQHVQKYHTGQHLNLSAHRPKNIRSKISTPCKVTKTSGNSSSKKLYARQRGKDRWFECPYCPFKSKWSTSVYHHKVRVHPELRKKCRTASAVNSKSPSAELNGTDADNTAEMNAKAKHEKPPSDHLLSRATSTPLKENVYQCEFCSTKLKSTRCLYSHRQMHLDYRRYQCPLCGLRSNYVGNTRAHIYKTHKVKNVDAIKLSVENAKQSIEAYKKHFFSLQSKKSVTNNAVAMNSSCNKTQQQGPSNVRLLSGVKRTPLKQSVRKCGTCSAKFLTAKGLRAHKKKVHLSFGRHQCPLCGFRSNYLQNVNKHICRVHLDENARAITLPLEDAKQTIEAYRKQQQRPADLGVRRYKCPICGIRSNYMRTMQKHVHSVHKDEKAKAIKLSLEDAKKTTETHRNQPVRLSRSWRKRLHCASSVKRNKLLHPAIRGTGKSRPQPLQYSMSAPNNDTVANSPEDGSVHVASKQSRLDDADTSQSYLGTDKTRLKKCYACSVCKIPTYHISSVYRHIRNVHHDRKARVIIIKGKLSVYQSKIALHSHRKRSWQPKAETSGNSCALYKQQTINNTEHDDCSGAEFGVQNTVKSEMHDVLENEHNLVQPASETNTSAPVQPSPEKCKVLKPYACDICPFRACSLRDITAHRKSHVKRTGYSFACDICPYFACQAAHLKRHKKLHAEKSTDVEKKVTPDQAVHRQRSEHKTTGRFVFCDYCPYMSDHKSAVMYHRQLHRPRTSALFKCEHCDFWVTESHHLYKHLVVHTAAYVQKRMKHSELPHSSISHGNDVTERASEKHKVMASGDASELDGLPVKNTVTADKDKLDEMSQNMSVNDGNKNTVDTESAAAITEENIDVSAHSRSSTISRQLPSWCCERCPYSSSRLACFKRHVWLHGKHYPYECRYCDYSVESYWQLVSHVLWHFAPNKHLVYAQPVSNLDSFPSQLPNRGSVPDSVASIDRFIPSFENSDVFLLSDASNFQCHCCPFVTEQRSEFFSHMSCHCMRNAAYKCPFCNFHSDVQDRLYTHVFLHFNLPGCRQSSLPPNTCQSDDWKRLDAAIEALVEKNAHDTEPHCVQTRHCGNLGSGLVDSASSLNADSLTAEKQPTRPSDCEDDLLVERPLDTLRAVCSEDDSTHTLSSVPQPAVAENHTDESVSSDNQHANVTDGTVSADSSPEDEFPSSNNVTSATLNKKKLCQYCDREIDDPAALAQHEARHLIGYCQQLPSVGKVLLYTQIY